MVSHYTERVLGRIYHLSLAGNINATKIVLIELRIKIAVSRSDIQIIGGYPDTLKLNTLVSRFSRVANERTSCGCFLLTLCPVGNNKLLLVFIRRIETGQV